jgi:hypothetical protein
MVLYETLRLYGTVVILGRVATANMDICSVKVPKGTVLPIPIAMLHRDEEMWGTDAGEFTPLRFQGGRTPQLAAFLLHRPAVVHRAGLRDAGGEGDAGDDPSAGSPSRWRQSTCMRPPTS